MFACVEASGCGSFGGCVDLFTTLACAAVLQHCRTCIAPWRWTWAESEPSGSALFQYAGRRSGPLGMGPRTAGCTPRVLAGARGVCQRRQWAPPRASRRSRVSRMRLVPLQRAPPAPRPCERDAQHERSAAEGRVSRRIARALRGALGPQQQFANRSAGTVAICSSAIAAADYARARPFRPYRRVHTGPRCRAAHCLVHWRSLGTCRTAARPTRRKIPTRGKND